MGEGVLGTLAALVLQHPGNPIVELLDINGRTLRLFVHVLAACVWVGGQIVMGALVPALRRVGETAPRAAANQFGVVAWSAYVVLLFTGIWNAIVVDFDAVSDAYSGTFGLKMTLFLISGVAAAVHQFVKKPAVRGPAAGVALLSGIGALLLGSLLTG